MQRIKVMEIIKKMKKIRIDIKNQLLLKSAIVITVYICFICCIGPNNRNKKNIPNIQEYESKNQENVGPASQYKQLKSVDSIFSYFRYVSHDHYALGINTICYNDSVNADETNIFNPIVLKQELYFLKNNRIISERESVSHKISQSISHGEEMEMLENVIYEIGVIHRKEKPIFVVYGYGGCNSCTEYFGYYSMDGKLLWEFYGSKIKNIICGANMNEKAKFGIPDSLYPENIKIQEVY